MTGSAHTTARLPRDLHPVAWWVWALGLATAASFTTNPLVLLTIAGVATLAQGGESGWLGVLTIAACAAALLRGASPYAVMLAAALAHGLAHLH